MKAGNSSKISLVELNNRNVGLFKSKAFSVIKILIIFVVIVMWILPLIGVVINSFRPFDPAFLYHKGAGPLFDMSPYYITALTSMFGSVKEVCSSAIITFAERTITSEPLYGQKITVEEPTHVNALLNFENGIDVNFTMSFDVFDTKIPHMEVYGNKGTLIMPGSYRQSCRSNYG